MAWYPVRLLLLSLTHIAKSLFLRENSWITDLLDCLYVQIKDLTLQQVIGGLGASCSPFQNIWCCSFLSLNSSHNGSQDYDHGNYDDGDSSFAWHSVLGTLMICGAHWWRKRRSDQWQLRHIQTGYNLGNQSADASRWILGHDHWTWWHHLTVELQAVLMRKKRRWQKDLSSTNVHTLNLYWRPDASTESL